MVKPLTINDKRITKLAQQYGVLAQHINTKRHHVFRLAKLPRGWKPVRPIRIDMRGKTLSEAIDIYNRLLIERNANKPEIQEQKLNSSGEINVQPALGVETVKDAIPYLRYNEIMAKQWTTNIIGTYVYITLDDMIRHDDTLIYEGELIIKGTKQNAGFILKVSETWRIIDFVRIWDEQS